MRDPGTTAAHLLAFHAEPVRYRPRLTHGREHFAGGIHVFRFAQGKFPEGLLRKLPAEERERLRAAASFFVRQVCFWDGATHYQVLGVAPDARPQVIREHYQGLMALIHPDRAADGGERWPDECAGRVNKAWAVLSDVAARKEYDAWLAKYAHAPGPFDGAEPQETEMAPEDIPGRRKSRTHRKRLRNALAAASLSLAGLFFAFTWWASNVPSEFLTLQHATPFALSIRWMRDVGSHARGPGFLGLGDAHALREAPRTDGEPELTRASLAARESKVASGQEPERPPLPVRPITVAAMPQASPAAPASKPADRSRSEPAVERATVEQRVAAAAPAGSDFAARLPDLEVLVTRIIAYYEGGDLERFIGLFDADSLGVVEAYRIRNDFEDFFRATTTRRLRIQHVDWNPADGKILAKGQAIVAAEYRDPANRIERGVNVEIDVVMRGERPGIARLSLFPHE